MSLKGLFQGIKKVVSQEQNGFSAQKTSNSRHLIKEEYQAAGTYYYTENINKLAICNPAWKYNKQAMIKNGMAGKRIFRYNYVNKPVYLIPEPKNTHDKNAVMIQIAGEKVGYIPAADAPHVKNILSKHEIKYISAFISGGQYKDISESGDIATKDELQLNVTIRLAYA